MNEAAFRTYVGRLEQAFRLGNATEHTYRPDLRDLLQTVGARWHITATNEPKREQYGAPDYLISSQAGHGLMRIGYVEAKDIGLSLDEIERSEQMQRYRQAVSNLVLTDYLEFRWYVNGERRAAARLAGVGGLRKLLWDAPGAAAVAALLEGFLTQTAEEISHPKDLAERMARLAHAIRELVAVSLERGGASATLRDLHQAFKEVLIPDLAVPAFADMFAQTLAYGLFAARCNHAGPDPFRRQDAAREIPKTNPFLRRLFTTITGPELDDENFIGFVDDLAQLLAQTNMTAVLADFGTRTRQEDPIIHFYETFLAAYDPKLRELRGVYYTPEPVVSYLVHSVDTLLKQHFGCPDGLADTATVTVTRTDEHGQPQVEQLPRVVLLDPACGTGTFSYNVIELIRERYRAQGNAGMWSSYVREHLLPRLFSFELLMAPYAMAHLKLGMQLAGLDLPEVERAKWAYDFRGEERLGIYLTNSLEESAKRSEVLLSRYISDEANGAARVKKDYPVMVLLGNPPYSGNSANKGEWITNLLHGKDGESERELGNYFKVDGQPLGERNPKWLNDDYVKFIRFAQWRIERTGHGILAFITNHGYLDNPTFRGMRQSLMQSFDELYVLNLHGNSKKQERAPNGSADENVFDIQQGVAIGMFVRRKRERDAASLATVHHADLWGDRDTKYQYLAAHSVKTTEWTTLSPRSPFYLFVPQDTTLRAEYEQGWKVTEMMPVNVLGFQTHRDHFAIDFDAASLQQRIGALRDQSISDRDYADRYRVSESPEWQLVKARQMLRSDRAWQTKIIPCLYRPFDWRFGYFSEAIMDRPRPELCRHMTHPNRSLNVTRQTKAEHWRNAVVANAPTPALYTEIKDGSNAFPLYLYPEAPKEHQLPGLEERTAAPGGRRANLSPAFIAAAKTQLGMEWLEDGKGDRQQTFGPEDVFSYLYAIFYAPTYRERYAEFLKMDFPRLPLTSNPGLFRALAALGDELVRLHLLEGHLPLTTTYPVKGNDVVETVQYTPPVPDKEPGRVWINKTQCFAGVQPEVWEFYVGGYQVCQKWLKDRKGRTLTHAEKEHYQKIVTALAETIRLMAAVDEIIEDYGGWPLTGDRR